MKYFENSFVQDRVKRFFINSINSNRLAHAYLFYGDDGTGKEAFAFELAKALNCSSEDRRPCGECPSCIKINHINHPDIKIIFPVVKQKTPEKANELVAKIIAEKRKNIYKNVEISGHKNIPIDTIRELKIESKYAPYEASKKVFIISEADYMSREATNSFLKLLEEPPENLIIILTTNDRNSLLETIRSRCQLIFFPKFSDEQIIPIIKRYEKTEIDLIPLIRIAQNNVKRVFSLLHSGSESQRELVYKFLATIASNNMLQVSNTVDEIIKNRDKNVVLEILNLLILWLRDSLHYSILNENSDFINIDFTMKIEKFVEIYKKADFNLLIELAEEAYIDITHNAHTASTLVNLAIEIKNHLIKTQIRMKESTV
ncbi:MAG: DNA polymerase III subunit delta' [Calditrichaceae bacterium]